MMLEFVMLSVEMLSILATGALVVWASAPCRTSQVPYLLGIPVGFGLITVAYVTETALLLLPPAAQFPTNVVYLLTQTYGFLFLAFVYARRTRLPYIGESALIELASALVLTIIIIAESMVAVPIQYSQNVASPTVTVNLFVRMLILLTTIYLVYETARNWSLTKKASQGFVVIGFAFLIVEQLGFILALANVGPVAIFLGYEGRLLGLFVLNAVLYVGVQKSDSITILKRLGLGAPVH